MACFCRGAAGGSIAAAGEAEGEPPQTLNVAEWTGPTNTGITGRETVLKVGDTINVVLLCDRFQAIPHFFDHPGSFGAGTAVTFTGERCEITPFRGQRRRYLLYDRVCVDNTEFAYYTSLMEPPGLREA